MFPEDLRPVCDQQDVDDNALNERNIRAALPGDVLRDSRIRGLHLRVFAGRKTFYLYFRTKAGVERRPKLGDYGSISLSDVRDVAREMLGEVAAGRDPSKERADARGEATLKDLWDEYWKRHGSKKKTSSEDERLWKKFLAPKLGNRKLSGITYPDMDDLHKGIPARVQANRVLALASTMFSFGVRPMEWMTSNPAQGVRRNREAKRRRYMQGGEAFAVAERLRIEAEKSPASVAFIYLLILTGARKGEIAGATWDMVRGNRLVLDDHKTDHTGEQRIIHLPPAAVAVLDRLPRTNGTITGIQNPKKLWEKIRVDAKCPDLRMHDLRHSFASAAISAGLSLPQIGELLGHRSAQTTKRYSHLMDDAAVIAVGSIADRIVLRMQEDEGAKAK